MFSFVIDRKTWNRGRGGSDSKLLDPSSGLMCCLGHLSLACGARDSDIENIVNPAKIAFAKLSSALERFQEHRAWRWLLHRGTFADGRNFNSMACSDAMLINDHSLLKDGSYRIQDYEFSTEKGRERELAKLFSRQGVKVTFVN